MATQIIMPRLGDSVIEVAVTRWLVQEKDPVEAFQPILEVETSMVGSEIPSPTSGVVLKILVSAGEKVKAGTLLAWIGQPDEAIPADPPPLSWKPQFQEEDETGRPNEADTIAVRKPEAKAGDVTPSIIEEPELPVLAGDYAPSALEKTGLTDWFENLADFRPEKNHLADWVGDAAPSTPVEPELPVAAGDAAPSTPEEPELPDIAEGAALSDFDFDFSDPNETLSVDASKRPFGHSDDTPPLGTRSTSSSPRREETLTEDGERDEETSSPTNFISPAVSRLAERHNVDLSLVTGTGESGRITKQDVERYIEARSFQETLAGTKHTPRPKAEADAAAHTPDEKIDRLEAPPHSAAIQNSVPISNWEREVTLFMTADMQQAAAHLAANKANFSRDGTHLTYTTYFVTAAIAALKTVPEANITRRGGKVIRQEEINIGLVVALGEEGLVAPVIKDADDLSLLGMARAVNELARRSRDQNLQPGETDNISLAVVNYGTTGARLAAPLVYPPACIVLGIGAVSKRPTVVDDAIAIRPAADLTLTFDPDALDGLAANRFLVEVIAELKDWG